MVHEVTTLLERDYKYLSCVPGVDGFSHPHQEHMIDPFLHILFLFISMGPKTINKQRDLFLYSTTKA